MVKPVGSTSQTVLKTKTNVKLRNYFVIVKIALCGSLNNVIIKLAQYGSNRIFMKFEGGGHWTINCYITQRNITLILWLKTLTNLTNFDWSVLTTNL